MAGHNGSSYLNDIWSIKDPAQMTVYSHWNQVNTPPWHARYGHAAAVDKKDNYVYMHIYIYIYITYVHIMYVCMYVCIYIYM